MKFENVALVVGPTLIALGAVANMISSTSRPETPLEFAIRCDERGGMMYVHAVDPSMKVCITLTGDWPTVIMREPG